MDGDEIEYTMPELSKFQSEWEYEHDNSYYVMWDDWIVAADGGQEDCFTEFEISTEWDVAEDLQYLVKPSETPGTWVAFSIGGGMGLVGQGSSPAEALECVIHVVATTVMLDRMDTDDWQELVIRATQEEDSNNE